MNGIEVRGSQDPVIHERGLLPWISGIVVGRHSQTSPPFMKKAAPEKDDMNRGTTLLLLYLPGALPCNAGRVSRSASFAVPLPDTFPGAFALPCTSRQLSWRLQSGTTSVHRFDSHDYSPAVFSFQQFSENFHGRCLFPALDWTGFRILFHQPEEPHLQTSTIRLTPENRFFCSGVR